MCAKWSSSWLRSTGARLPPDLIDAPGLDAARQLPADVGRIHVPCQQQPCLEDRLIADNSHQPQKIHAGGMPQMASYCNQSTLTLADLAPTPG